MQKKSHIQPQSNFILVEIQEVNETKSGVVLPESHKGGKAEVGTVKAVGVDVENIKKNDTIIFKNYNVDDVTIDDKIIYFIEASDVLAVVK